LQRILSTELEDILNLAIALGAHPPLILIGLDLVPSGLLFRSVDLPGQQYWPTYNTGVKYHKMAIYFSCTVGYICGKTFDINKTIIIYSFCVILGN